MKLVGSVPRSVGGVLSHFPWNPLDKGQAREASAVCAGGEEMGGLRAGPGNADLAFQWQEKTSPDPSSSVLFCRGAIRMAPSILEGIS